MSAESLALFIASIVAGGIGSITGFGIGSILTPLLSLWMDGRIAVAVVAIPHFVGTAVRFMMNEGGVDRTVLLRFGLASALGGLAGALRGIPEPIFRKIVAVLLGILGIALLIRLR